MSDTAIPPRTPAQLRDELQSLIVGELRGPAGGEDEEVSEDRLTERYILGTLAPTGSRSDPDEQDRVAVEGETSLEEGDSEPDAPAIPSIFPSSFGFTFTVAGDATEIAVTPRWGRYERERSQIEGGEDKPPLVWRRYPMGGRPLTIRLDEGLIEPIQADSEQPSVVVRGRARFHDDEWLITLFIVNRQEIPEKQQDEAWLFQVELAVEHPQGRAIFRRRSNAAANSGDAEERSLEMLYRDEVEFAVGHGVSVHAEVDPTDARRAVRIHTRAVPAYDVQRTDPPTAEDVPELANITLDMKTLAEAGDTEIVAMLTPLVDAYEAWTARQRGRINDAEARLDGFEDIAPLALERCERAATRIRVGIELLGQDPDSATAFRFANRAMRLQRVRSIAAESRRHDPSLSMKDAFAAIDVPENRSWRPFQLAFILLNLPPLVDPTHEDRAPGGQGRVDLLWFPTGGGKTEAYLGLIAFTLAMRRLQGDVSGYDGRDGVAAIMRYTLRLLTIQQFQRASALLCACEMVRAEMLAGGDVRWDGSPFRIGLWVGMRATPNSTDEAAEWLKQVKGAGPYRGRSGSPAQLTYCPWCGANIDEKKHITVYPELKRTVIYCGDKYGRCPFTEKQRQYEGLPVVVVDEEIYRLLPALLVGTVDKFAQLPWRGPVQTLFGHVTGCCERHGFRSPDLEDSDSHPKKRAFPAAKTVPAGPLRPPDLIVQDELHLIAGPLGSMVGLYETAVDELSSWEVDGQQVRPKVIASTATVRRAPQQAYALFWRGLDIFPPPGLDANDSFFALQRESTEETPGRRYLGICAHGRQFKNALIRVYVAQMAAAQALLNKYGSAADPWMTTVGYFNSLKDLGGMRRHVDDDVSARLGRVDRRGLARRQRPIVEELTSRRSSTEIPRILDQLSNTHKKDKRKDDPTPIDVLLATNMISVGVDVPRLGGMIVAGQPKGTAEYIQATSRVGRDKKGPGLVLVMYGWARPRDLSHYERFEHYHATFYRHVEALSVTPFAVRARDRALTAVLVALIRQLEPTWNADVAAQDVVPDADLVKKAMAVIKSRAGGVASLPSEDLDEINAALQQRMDEWEYQRNVEGRRIAYRDRKDGVTIGLLRGPGIGKWTTWTALTSLRDVEAGINLLLDQDDLGDAAAPRFEAATQPQGESESPEMPEATD